MIQNLCCCVEFYLLDWNLIFMKNLLEVSAIIFSLVISSLLTSGLNSLEINLSLHILDFPITTFLTFQVFLILFSYCFNWSWKQSFFDFFFFLTFQITFYICITSLFFHIERYLSNIFLNLLKPKDLTGSSVLFQFFFKEMVDHKFL